MKKLLMASLIVLGSSSAMANTLLNCVVPSETNAVKMNIELIEDQSSDFVVVSLVERAKTSQFFSQMDKGSVADQMKNGYLQLLALTEQTSQVDGVITNTGFLGLGLEADGSFGGFLAANGNIYPLTCTK